MSTKRRWLTGTLVFILMVFLAGLIGFVAELFRIPNVVVAIGTVILSVGGFWLWTVLNPD